MTIWIDADACPKAIREIVYRAAHRTKTPTVVVANSFIAYPSSSWVRAVQVQKGFDSADSYIVEHLTPHDLVITQDIPFAALVLEQKGHAISPRGEVFSSRTIGSKLSIRQFHEEVRMSGVMTKGQGSFSDKEKMAFSNALDQWLTKHPSKP